MVKLIYPDMEMTEEEAYELVDFAAEGRKRVKDQLYIIDETFKAEPAKFKYINLKTGSECAVETLEMVSNSLESTTSTISQESGDDHVSDNKDDEDKGHTKRPRIVTLIEQSLSFRMGQTGVTYQKLFAPYLQQANEITVEDPYIRTSWQIKNFMEFVTMLIDTRPVDDLKLNLITNEEEDKIPELIDKLDDIKDDLTEYGIVFNYQLRDFHDRCIKTDTGWNITLGRGLDIFEKYNTYSIASSRQAQRKCKEFTVIYLEKKS